MVVRPAAIAQVADFQLHVLIKFLASLICSFLLNLLLHRLGIKHGVIKVQLAFLASVLLLGSLTLFKLLAVKFKLCHLLVFLLYFSQVITIMAMDSPTSLLKVLLGLKQRLLLLRR